MTVLTKEEIQHIADEAAKKAVRRVLITMGIDIDDNTAILKAQKDAAFTRAWRESAESVRATSLRTAAIVLITGLMGLIGLWLHGGGKP